MSACDAVQAAVVAEAVSAEDRRHLEACGVCREVERGHLGAKAVRHLEPRLDHRVRRRAVLVRGGLLVVALGALTAGLVTRDEAPTQPSPVAVTTPTLPETSVRALPVVASADEEWAAFADFTSTLAADLRREVSTHDTTYAAFGALPQWVAPGSTLTAMED